MDEAEFWKWVAGMAIGLLGSTLLLVVKGVFGRLRRVEETKADKADVDDVKKDVRSLTQTVNEQYKEASTKRKDMHGKLEAFMAAQNEQNVKVAELIGILKGRLNGSGSGSGH